MKNLLSVMWCYINCAHLTINVGQVASGSVKSGDSFEDPDPSKNLRDPKYCLPGLEFLKRFKSTQIFCTKMSQSATLFALPGNLIINSKLFLANRQTVNLSKHKEGFKTFQRGENQIKQQYQRQQKKQTNR